MEYLLKKELACAILLFGIILQCIVSVDCSRFAVAMVAALTSRSTAVIVDIVFCSTIEVICYLKDGCLVW